MNTYKLKRFGWSALKGVIFYAIIWTGLFGFCFVINKAVGDQSTATILQYVRYAGYPLLGIGWALGWIVAGGIFVLSKILLGVIYMLKMTFPYCLYFIGIPFVCFILYKIAQHLASNPGPSLAEQQAEARHQEHMRTVKEALLLRSLSDMNKH